MQQPYANFSVRLAGPFGSFYLISVAPKIPRKQLLGLPEISTNGNPVLSFYTLFVIWIQHGD